MIEIEPTYDQLMKLLPFEQLRQILGDVRIKEIVLGSFSKLSAEEILKLENAAGVITGANPSNDSAAADRMPDPLVQPDIE